MSDDNFEKGEQPVRTILIWNLDFSTACMGTERKDRYILYAGHKDSPMVESISIEPGKFPFNEIISELSEDKLRRIFTIMFNEGDK